ncbi:MAG: hypothetical protein KAV87_64045 [Desulfobacteraceae bacterium]|nr:hypothetical protein [Desulfobacteraceae bacterium]
MVVKPGKILICAGNKTEDLIAHYLERIGRDIACLKCALNNGHFEAIRILGRSMKYSGESYGFKGISQIGGAMEDASKSRDSKLLLEQVEKLLNYSKDIDIEYD